MQATQQLHDLGLKFDFIDAVDGTAGTAMFSAVDVQQHVLHTGRPPAPGEIGCFASHILAWRRCCESNAPICVLEDDFEAADFFPEALAAAARWISEYGFIRLQTETRAKKVQVAQSGDFVLHRYTKMAHSTLGYVIDPRVARCFIDASSVMLEPVDVFIKRFWNHRQPLYGLTPYAVRESSLSDTSIITKRERSKKSMAVQVRRSATRLGWFFRRVVFNLNHWNKRQ